MRISTAYIYRCLNLPYKATRAAAATGDRELLHGPGSLRYPGCGVTTSADPPGLCWQPTLPLALPIAMYGRSQQLCCSPFKHLPVASSPLVASSPRRRLRRRRRPSVLDDDARRRDLSLPMLARDSSDVDCSLKDSPSTSTPSTFMRRPEGSSPSQVVGRTPELRWVALGRRVRAGPVGAHLPRSDRYTPNDGRSPSYVTRLTLP